MILKCDLHFKISPYILLPYSFFLFVRKNDFQPLFYQIPKSTFHVKMPAFVLSKPKNISQERFISSFLPYDLQSFLISEIFYYFYLT